MSIRSILVTTAIAIFATGVVAEARAQGQKDWRKEGPCSEEVKNFCALLLLSNGTPMFPQAQALVPGRDYGCSQQVRQNGGRVQGRR